MVIKRTLEHRLVAETTGLDRWSKPALLLWLPCAFKHKFSEKNFEYMYHSSVLVRIVNSVFSVAVAGQACTGVVDALGLQGAASNLAGAAVVNICK
jgi:hypothetical protein